MNFKSFFAARPFALFLAAVFCLLSVSPALATTVTTSPLVVQFPATAVGSTSTVITETVTLTGFTGSFSFTQHYYRDFGFNGPTCTGTGTVTCTLTVYFQPRLPGVRKEAIFIMNGSTRIGTILLSGIGTAPLAALQPGVFTQPAGMQVAGGYAKAVVADENSVLYFYNSVANAIQSCAAGCGSATTLVSNVGNIYDLSIDGAGVLYWGQASTVTTAGTVINTYDTVQSLQGTVTTPASDVFYNTTVDGAGNIFALGNSSNILYKLAPGGSSTTTALSPVVSQPYYSVADSQGDLFIGGFTINELTVGGTQTQVSTNGNDYPLTVDAASTLYTASGAVATELAAGNYAGTGYALPVYVNSAITGITSASSGTLTFGTAGGAYQVDRSQDTVALGSQAAGTATTVQTVNYLNIGNTALTVSNIALTGAGYTLQTAATAPCTAGIALAAGASCNIAFTFNGAHAGNYPGTIVLTSNSLNNSSSNQTITMSAFINGAYLTASPTLLNFNPQVIASTSGAQTITVTNSGFGGPATLSNLASTSSNFTATPGSCGATLNVGASCNLSVTFTPTAPQSYSTTISMTGNEGGGTANSNISVSAVGTGLPVVAQTGGSNSNNVLLFNAAAVGIAAGSAQSITATYTISGYSATVTPTASMHTGTSYSITAQSCSGPVTALVCTVTVRFIPIYPGARKDAIFLNVGPNRVATTLVDGIGQAPFALVQPGVVTTPILNGANYFYGSAVDENGTVYILQTQANTVFSLVGTTATALPISGLNSPRGIGIDGAGVLYIADQASNGFLKYYDTVQGIQGTINVQGTSNTLQSMTTGNSGNLYSTDSSKIYTTLPNGTTTATAINPAFSGAGPMAVDSNEDVFINGYDTNKILPNGGAQTQVNTNGGGSGISADAAGTLYISRYSALGHDSIGELAAADYTTAIAELDPGANPLGSSIGPDGTLYDGNYTNFDKVDRSQGAVTFGSLSTGSPSTSTLQLYNGGNQPLTLASLAVTGSIYTLTPASSNTCTSGLSIAVGAVCNVVVTAAPTHAGTFPGTVTFTSNSLNTTATTQTVALTGYVNGVYVTPSPTTLTFANQAVNTTSAAQTITLTNTGVLYTAGIGTFSANAGFAVNSGTCSTGVAPGGSCTISVTFTPTAVQAYTNLTFTATVSSSGGGANQSVNFTASGTGFTPQLSVVPTALAYAATVGSTSPPQNVLVTNIGSTTITNLALSLTGASVASFTQTVTTCTATLAPAGSCTASVTFTPPGTAGPYTAAFTATGGSSTATTTLTGTGNPFIAIPQLQFTPSALTVFAGTGAQCTRANLGLGDGGAATAANLCAAFAASIDPSGNVYITDSQANNVRKVTPAGIISTYAGLASANGLYSGDGGLAPAAGMNFPVDTIFDLSGNGYIVDLGNSRLRKVSIATDFISTLYGPTSGFFNGTTGSIPVADTGSLAYDPSGNMYFAGGYSHLVIKVTPAGEPSIFAGMETNSGPGAAGYSGDGGPAYNAELNNPQGVASDLAGNIYIADTNNFVIRKVSAATGIISTYAGNGTQGGTGDGGAATSATLGASYVSTDLAGDVYAIGLTAQQGYAGNYNVVRKITPAGIISTFAGSGAGTIGGVASAASLPSALGVSRPDMNGNLIIPSYTYTYTVGGSGLLAFGSQSINTTTTQVLTLQNTGNTPLVFGSTPYTMTGSSAFTVTSSSCSGSIAVAATCTVTVNFLPTTAVGFTASLAFASNAQGGTETAALTGTGVAPSAAQAVFSPTSLSFGSIAVGSSSAAQIVTLSNPGSATLTSLAYSVADSQFSSTTTCGTSLAVGGSCTYTITFTPNAVGNQGSNIAVADNLGTQNVPLTGVGTGAAQAVFSPTSLTFASTPLGSSTAAQIVTLSNPGNVALTGLSYSVANNQFSATTTCGTTLAAGGSCTFSIIFTPSAVGTQTSNIAVTDSLGAQNVPLTGVGAGTAQAVLTPASYAFSSTLVGSSAATETIVLSNPGTAVLSVTSIIASGAGFSQTNTCGSSVAVNGSCNIVVTFTPGSAAALTGSVTVTDNATPTTQTATFTGTGIASQAALTASLAFPSTVVNTTATAMTATLTNGGSAALPITSATLTGSQFALTSNTCGASLAAGSTCAYTITFTPTATGAQSGSLAVVDSVGTQTTTITGTGTAAPAPQAALTAAVAFPSTVINTTATAMTATLTNAGTAALPITSATVSGPFALSANTCGSSLAAGASCSYSITFTPTATGAQTGSLTVVDSVGTQTAALTGTGAPVPVAQAVLSPTTFSFPSTFMGTPSAPQVFTLSNPGTATLTGIAVSFTGTNPTAYAQTTTCGATLAAAASCTISVVFTPAAANTYTANLSVANSIATQTATLTGTGNSSTGFTVVAPTPSQSVDPGGAAAFNINVNTLTGNYTLPVTLTASGLPPGATYSFTPAVVTPGTTGAPSVLTIQTSAAFALSKPLSVPIYAVLLFLPLAGLRRVRRSFRKLSPALRLLTLLFLSLAAMIPLSGCAGGYFGAPAQAYTVTVTGTSAAATQSTTVTLNLQ